MKASKVMRTVVAWVMTVSMLITLVPATAVFAENDSSAVLGETGYALSADAQENELGLMVSAEDLANALGLDYEFDSENKTFTVYDEVNGTVMLMHNATQFAIGDRMFDCLPFFYLENGVPMVEAGFFAALYSSAYTYDAESGIISAEYVPSSGRVLVNGRLSLLDVMPYDSELGINTDLESLAKAAKLEYSFDEGTGTAVLTDEVHGDVTLTDGGTTFTSNAGEFECEKYYNVTDGVPTIEIGFFAKMYGMLESYDADCNMLVLKSLGEDGGIQLMSEDSFSAMSVYGSIYGYIGVASDIPEDGLTVKLLLQQRGTRSGVYVGSGYYVGETYELGDVEFVDGEENTSIYYRFSNIGDYYSTDYPYYALLYEVPEVPEYGYYNTNDDVTTIDYSPTEETFTEYYNVKKFYSDSSYSRIDFTVCRESEYGGKCGEVNWDFDEDTNTLSITGEGAMGYFTNGGEAPWYQFKDDILYLNIADGVTSIGQYAFYGLEHIGSVIIPASVYDIGYGAFENCTSLYSVSLNAGLGEISGRAFKGCTNLGFLYIPSSVTQIYYQAFMNCTDLYEVDLKAGLESIGSEAFKNCTALNELTIPKTVTYMDTNIFNGCDIVLGVYINSSGFDYAEEYGITYELLDSPSSGGGSGSSSGGSTVVGGLGGSFGDNIEWEYTTNGILTLSGSGEMENLSESEIPWIDYKEDIVKVVIGDGITKLGMYVFSDCTALSEVSFGADVECISAYAFSGCSSLAELTFPDTLKEIHGNAFEDCTALGELEIPESVTNINYMAFYGCSELTDVFILNREASIVDRAFLGCDNLTIHGYSGSTAETYANNNDIPFVVIGQAAVEPSAYKKVSGTLSFDENAFIENESLTVQIWAHGDVDYQKTRFEISSVGDYPFEIVMDEDETAAAVRIIITNPKGAYTNVYTETEFTYTSEGFGVEGDTWNGTVSIDELTDLDIVIPSGKMISGKVTGDDLQFAADENMTILIGDNFWTRATVDAETGEYFAVIPYGLEKDYYTLAIEKCEESGFSNILNGIYYNDKEATRISPYEDLTGIDFTVETGYAVSGTVTIPSDAKLSNYRLEAAVELNDECYYIAGLGRNEGFSNENRAVSYMFGIPRGSAAYVSGIVKLSIYGGTDDDMINEAVSSNIYEGTYYYSPNNSSCLEETGAATVTVNGDIENIDFALQTGYALNVQVYGNAMQSDSASGEFEVVTEDGVILNNDNWFYVSDAKDVFSTSMVVPKSFIGEKVYISYNLEYDRYGDNPNIYTGKVFMNPDGSFSTLKKDATPHVISEENNVKFTLVGISDVEEYETVEYNGVRLESTHPYAGNTTQEYYYSYEGEIDATQLKVTFSPMTGMYNANASLTICDGEGNTYVYDYDKENYTHRANSLAGETIILEGSKFTVTMTTNYIYAGTTDYGFAIVDIEPVGEIRIDPDDPNYGYTEISVVDAKELTPIEGANLHFVEVASDESTVQREFTYETDASGKLSRYIPVGSWTVSAYKDGLLPRSFSMTITHEGPNTAQIGLSSKPLVDVEMSSDVMTLDEIKAAGIDTTDPANQHVVKYDVVLTFGGERVNMTTYFNDNHIHVGPTHRHTFNLATGTIVHVYPVSEHFYLMVYGEVQWLKEMFDVEMLIMNNSNTDTFENGTATLVLPDGLSLAAMVEEEQTLKQTVPSIGNSQNHTLHWYVKGDKAGEYNIGANLKGNLVSNVGGLSEAIDQTYTLPEPIKVYAGNALHMDIYVPDMTFYGDSYPITIKLTNVSDRTLYNISNSIKYFKAGKVVHWSNGAVIHETYLEDNIGTDNLASIGAEEFKPGDMLELTVEADIEFRSTMLRASLAEIGAHIENVDDLLNAYEAYLEGAALLDESYDFASTLSAKLEEIITAKHYSGTQAANATRLKEAAAEFNAMLETVNNKKAMDMINKLKTTGIYTVLEQMIKSGDIYGRYSTAQVSKHARTMEAVVKSEEITEDDLKVTEEMMFVLIARAIESIPIKYYLKDVVVATLEGSTTTIPCTVHTISTGERFGIEKLDSYLDNIIVSAIGLPDVPWQMGIGGRRPHFEKKDIVFVKERPMRFAASDNTGKIVFRAWVDDALRDYFELISTNETAVFTDGVLTFTGPGYIEVKPLKDGVNGKFYVEVNGVVTEYVFTSVAPHACHSEEWITVVAPDENVKGYRVKYCDECHEIFDMGSHADACENHVYGDYVLEYDANGEALGLKHRVCADCGRVQYVIIDASASIYEFILTPESHFVMDGADIADRYLSNVLEKLTPAHIRSHFENENIEVINADGNVITAEANVGTGSRLEITNNEDGTTKSSLTVVVKGDVSGDAQIDIFDMVGIFNHILGRKSLNGAYHKAAFVDEDESIDIFDMVRMYNHILGNITIR